MFIAQRTGPEVLYVQIKNSLKCDLIKLNFIVCFEKNSFIKNNIIENNSLEWCDEYFFN